MRTRTRFLIAAAMFAVCVGIGSLADNVMLGAVSWLAQGGGSSRRLQMTVLSGPHAMRLRNLTDETWPACVVSLEGGYVSPSLSVEPRGTAVIPYAVFTLGEQPLGDVEGFGRAFRSTAIECADREQQREFAVLR